MKRLLVALAMTVALACKGGAPAGAARHDAAMDTVPASAGTGAPNGGGALDGTAVGEPVSAERVRAVMGRARVPGLALAVVRDGGVAFVRGYGDADRERARAVTADTPFEAASLAKTVVAMAVLDLVQRGVLDLDADVSARLPFALKHPSYPDVPITARMLLAHTASIADDLAVLKRPAGAEPRRETFERYFAAREHFLRERPGAHVVYSNAGYAVAVLLVESVSRRSFEDQARERVLAPLGMRASAWHLADAGPTLAVAYRATEDAGFRPLVATEHVVGAPVDFFSTARDLATLAASLLEGGRGVLSPENVARMLDGRLGCYAIELPGGQAVVGHEGEDDGASTAMLLDRSSRRAAVVLTNGDAFTSDRPSRARAIAELARELLTAP